MALHGKQLVVKIEQWRFAKKDYDSWIKSYEAYSIFGTSVILELLIFIFVTYWYISNVNFTANSKKSKFFESAHANFLKRDFLSNAWANIFFWLQIRNQRKIPRRMMYINIWFILNLPMFPIFRTYSRLRKYEFAGKRRRIRSESYSLIHQSTRNFTLIPNLKSKKYFCLRILEKISF